MPVATVTVTVDREVNLDGEVMVHGSLAVSASPDTYAAGGLALGVAEFRNKTKIGSQVDPPFDIFIRSQAGYTWVWDKANSKAMIRQDAAAGAPSAEIGTAAVPAGVSGDTVRFVAYLPKLG